MSAKFFLTFGQNRISIVHRQKRKESAGRFCIRISVSADILPDTIACVDIINLFKKKECVNHGCKTWKFIN